MSSGNWINISIKRKKLDFKPSLGIPSQQESQKIEFILLVLDCFLKNKLVNATELEKKLFISRDSIDRTIKLLLQHHIIKLKMISYRNKKFYTVKNKEIAKIYRKKLFQWMCLKELRKDKRIIQAILKFLSTYGIVNKNLSYHYKRNLFRTRKAEDILSKFLIVEKKTNTKSLKKTLKPVLINDLPHSKAAKIIKDYLNGKFCDTCLKDGKLCELKTDIHEVEQGCKYGHVIRLIL